MNKVLKVAIIGAVLAIVTEYVVRPYITAPIEDKVEERLTALNVNFNKARFKPSKEECSVCEQLFALIDSAPVASGVELKPFRPSSLQPIKK